jgi:hypothetical protein
MYHKINFELKLFIILNLNVRNRDCLAIIQEIDQI